MSVESVVTHGMEAVCVGLAVASTTLLVTSNMHGTWRYEHVRGQVIGVSDINYAGHRTARCAYVVDGVQHVVDGPLFMWGSASSGISESNLTYREDLPLTLRVPAIATDQLAVADTDERAYERSAIAKLYPIGSDVDIWYDLEDPDRAFVERPCPRHVLETIMCAGGFVAALLGLGLMRAIFT